MDSKELNQGITGAGSSSSNSNSEVTPITNSAITTLPLKASTSTTSTATSPAPEVPKILSRNANGTVVLTSSPNNEAELQLYRVMQRASLLAYYDTLLEMGGDDVQQLCDAGEEEFLEIMALVGMASKPLHVRRLQKALQEWVTSPALFQTPLTPTIPQTPPNFPTIAAIRPATSVPVLSSTPVVTVPSVIPSGSSSVMPAVASASAVAAPVKEVPLPPRSPSLQVSSYDATNQREGPRGPSPGPCLNVQSPGSPLQLTPVLVDSQISRLADAAEALVKSLPQFEPKPHNTKKKICRDLENVMNMSEDDPRRMDEIRKYAAIYGRFDCKRKPEKPLTLHEVSVNEAAAQICRFAPALLTRRDELFPLARQVVRDSGYHYSKGHSSVTPMYRTHSYQLSNKNGDDNHSTKRAKVESGSSLSPSLCDINDMDKIRRQERLEQIAEDLKILGDKTEELVQAAQQVRQTNDLSSIHNLQQQMEAVQSKKTQLLLEQSDLLKQPLPMRFYRRNSNKTSSNYNDSERHDTDDTDSQFSLSNASSPSQEVGDSRDSLLRDGENFSNNSNGPSTSVKSPGKITKQFAIDISNDDCLHRHGKEDVYDSYYQENKIQVISSSGGNIIAVANPALSMSSVIIPTSTEANSTESPLSLKIESKLINHKPD